MKIYFSKYNHCQSISLSSVDNVLYFSCEQKEADREFLVTVNTFEIYKKMHILLSGQHQAIYTS